MQCTERTANQLARNTLRARVSRSTELAISELARVSRTLLTASRQFVLQELHFLTSERACYSRAFLLIRLLPDCVAMYIHTEYCIGELDT